MPGDLTPSQRGGLKTAMVGPLRQAKPARGRRRTTLLGSSWSRNTVTHLHQTARGDEAAGAMATGKGDLESRGGFNRSSVGTLVERAKPAFGCCYYAK